MEDTADRQRWVDIEALLAEDADTDVLRAEGANACRWGLGELGQMVDLLLRRQAAAVARVTSLLGEGTAPPVPGTPGRR